MRDCEILEELFNLHLSLLPLYTKPTKTEFAKRLFFQEEYLWKANQKTSKNKIFGCIIYGLITSTQAKENKTYDLYNRIELDIKFYKAAFNIITRSICGRRIKLRELPKGIDKLNHTNVLVPIFLELKEDGIFNSAGEFDRALGIPRGWIARRVYDNQSESIDRLIRFIAYCEREQKRNKTDSSIIEYYDEYIDITWNAVLQKTSEYYAKCKQYHLMEHLKNDQYLHNKPTDIDIDTGSLGLL